MPAKGVGTVSEPDREIIGFVVGTEDPVTMCGPCGAEEIERVGTLRENDAYGEQVPYPECYKCGGVIRPPDPPRKQYRCKRCGKRFDALQSVQDHARSHNGEVDVPLYEVVDRDAREGADNGGSDDG